jgi:hypothetical protein
MAEQFHGGLADRDEHVAAADMRCGGINLEPISHDCPLRLPGIAL